MAMKLHLRVLAIAVEAELAALKMQLRVAVERLAALVALVALGPAARKQRQEGALMLTVVNEQV